MKGGMIMKLKSLLEGMSDPGRVANKSQETDRKTINAILNNFRSRGYKSWIVPFNKRHDAVVIVGKVSSSVTNPNAPPSMKYAPLTRELKIAKCYRDFRQAFNDVFKDINYQFLAHEVPAVWVGQRQVHKEWVDQGPSWSHHHDD
jgi:hypothetical protein